MNLPDAIAAAAAAALLPVVAGCGSGSADEVGAGPVVSDLAPTYDPRPRADKARPGERSANDRARDRRPRRRSGDAARGARMHPSANGERREKSRDTGGSGAAAVRGTAVATAPPVRVEDPSGDLSRGLEGAPASADILSVQLSRRGDTIEVRTTFGAAVPRRQTDGKGMNVAAFYDVDDNGVVDYEVWTSLADNGWSTGYLDRRKERASFGASTGARVTVEGDTLVTRFPVDRIAGARVFRWSAASEWGSYESMSSSTSARDYAPDRGSVDYPG